MKALKPINVYSDDFSKKEKYAITNVFIRINAKANFCIIRPGGEGKYFKSEHNPSLIYTRKPIITYDKSIQVLKNDEIGKESDLDIIKNYSKGKLENTCIDMLNGSVVVGFDLFKLAFYFLARVEEYETGNGDLYDRFKSQNDFLCTHALNIIPIVDELSYLLGDLIEEHHKTALNFRAKKNWNGHRFAVGLSHDIDRLKGKSIARYIYWGLKGLISIRRNKNEAKNYFNQIIRWIKLAEDPYWNLYDILKFNEQNGISSTFFFLSLRNFIADGERRYRINNRNIAQAIKELDQKNNEIGMHALNHSIDHIDRLKREKERLENAVGKEVLGIRNHYLKFHFPDTWKIDQQLGLKYDSTLGWQDNVGFRAGTCWPFFGYDAVADNSINVLEIPLVIMDGVLDHILSADLNCNAIVDKTLTIIDKVENYGGAVAVLWHNDYLNQLEHPEHWKAYKEIINHLKTRDVSIGTLLGIHKMWLAQFGEP